MKGKCKSCLREWASASGWSNHLKWLRRMEHALYQASAKVPFNLSEQVGDIDVGTWIPKTSSTLASKVCFYSPITSPRSVNLFSPAEIKHKLPHLLSWPLPLSYGPPEVCCTKLDPGRAPYRGNLVCAKAPTATAAFNVRQRLWKARTVILTAWNSLSRSQRSNRNSMFYIQL